MDMQETFERLKELQTVLLRKNELENNIANAPAVLNKHEQLLARLKQEYVEKNKFFENIRADINQLKGELFQVEQRRENAEKGMETVETQRDYEALERTISEAKSEENRLRSEIENANEHFRAVDAEIKDKEQIIAENELEINTMKASLAESTKKMTDEIKELDSQKDEFIQGLDDETIFKFERIIKNKHGDGIVSVKGGVCSGCHMILPAQFANEVQTELKYCPYCSRVLYYEASDEVSDEYSFDEADMGGLADLDD